MYNIKPMNDKVVLIEKQLNTQTYGSIVRPDMGKEKPIIGEVVQTNDGFYLGDNFVKSSLEVGDLVLIPLFGTIKTVIDKQEYLICAENNILGKLIKV